MNLRSVKSILSILFMVVWAGAASASTTTTYCPGDTSSNPDRQFTLTTDPASGCLGYGTLTQIQGDTVALSTIQALPGAPADLVFLDKTDSTSIQEALPGALSYTAASDRLSGTFSFSAPNYDHFVLLLQSGGGTNSDPVWAAFTLGAGVTSGDWSIIGATNGLSHIALYGVSTVPLPATGLLLIGGLAGLAALKRRRKAVA